MCAWESQWKRPQVVGDSDKPKVCIGLPHTGFVAEEWASAFNALKKPEPYTCIEMTGQPVDKARNLIVKKFLEYDSPWLFFLDVDVVLGELKMVDGREEVVSDRNALLKMIQTAEKHNISILTGIYYRRSDPPVPGIYKYFPDMKPAPGHKPIMEYPLNQLFPVDAVGAGCLLVHKKVFETVPRPWFLFGDVDQNEFSEDFYMNHKCSKYNFPTICMPTIQCKHLLLLSVSRTGIRTANM